MPAARIEGFTQLAHAGRLGEDTVDVRRDLTVLQQPLAPAGKQQNRRRRRRLLDGGESALGVVNERLVSERLDEQAV